MASINSPFLYSSLAPAVLQPVYRRNMQSNLRHTTPRLDDQDVPTVLSIQRTIDREWELSKPWYWLLTGSEPYLVTARESVPDEMLSRE